MDMLKCPICKNYYSQPRVLFCLHVFCGSCLTDHVVSTIHIYSDIGQSQGNVSDVLSRSESSYHYEFDDKFESEVNLSTSNPYTTQAHIKMVRCVLCNSETKLPNGDINELPYHYGLERKANNAKYQLKDCELCTSGIWASSRCVECNISMCGFCLKTHSQLSDNESHTIVPITNPGSKSPPNTKKVEVSCCGKGEPIEFFCSDCGAVVCKVCRAIVHQRHHVMPVETAARAHSKALTAAIEAAKASLSPYHLALDALLAIISRIKDRCSEVEKEVHTFLLAYREALDEHEKSLLDDVNKVKERKLAGASEEQKALRKKMEQTEWATTFAEMLLNECSDTEMVSVVGVVLERLEWCSSRPKPFASHTSAESLRFLRDEKISFKDFTVFGVVTTQAISPSNSYIQQKGLAGVRQNKMCQLTAVSCDSDGEPLPHGGETLVADLRYSDVSQRIIPIYIEDNGDGTYTLSFSPDSAGSMTLSLFIRGQHIQGSPLTVLVPPFRCHQGLFHCCTFCSSGGSKKATCGCGAKMPGGYNGCGHGHNGHPGRRHWSCCGATQANSECSKEDIN